MLSYSIIINAIFEITLSQALKATAIHRGSEEKINDRSSIISIINDSDELKNMWVKYQNRFSYASSIQFDDLIRVLKQVLNI